jgi:hypothetical protein
LDHDGNEQLDFSRLRARLRGKPRTKVGQVRQAWPDIKALFAAGHSLKDIWMWLNEIGIEIGYARLSHYVGQLRRREEAARLLIVGQQSLDDGAEPPRPDLAAHSISHAVAEQHPEQPSDQSDPLANIIERERQRPGFDYNSEPDSKKLI